MEKDPSPLDTLRQLKEWLDAGTITPDEFQTLKQKLVFAPAANPPAPSETAAPPSPIIPGAPVSEAGTTEPSVPEAPAEVLPPLVLPPITAPISVVPEPLLPPVPPIPEPKPAPFQPAPFQPEPTTVAPVEMAPMLPPITHVPATGPSGSDEQEYVEEDAYTAPRKSPLMTIVVVVAILALFGLVAYLFMDGRDSERLTSTSRTEADSVAVQPEIGPQTEQIELPPVVAPETIRVAPVAAPVIVPTPADTAVATAPPTASPSPATPVPNAPAVLSESAVRARVETIMQRYYADLQAAPFTASAYFAPQVERFYLMQSTTPAAINAELAKTHFPEFLEGQGGIQPGTLQVGTPVADGSRVVTYVEDSKAFRQSRQELQRTSAQIRIRFDKDFKIVYLRQEKLLKNEFGD